ncbi:MAG: ABC transporter permease subunit [Candidatus Eisenbacteria bacterium]|nr:ABC transporter permease subunit [Candidatus Latescibacterota bacterium]MBD3303100.1 ABC transporter permease subunit [Candidatus Eisenbacteria bacterium]
MKRAGLGFAVLLLIGFSTGPFLWSVVTSVKPAEEIYEAPPTYLPEEISTESYTEVFARRPFGRYLLNSLIVAAGSTLVALLAGSLAAYGLARLGLPGAGGIERAILFFALFPPAVLLVPLFSVARQLGLINSYLGLILVHAALNLPFVVWTLGAFFRGFPREIEEAARVDGFSRLRILVRIVLPLSAPAIAATAILTFIFSWNEFVIALTFMQRDAMRTVPVGISMLSGATVYDVPWGQISAAIVMTTLPVVAAVLAFQRWILRGLTAGSIKG